MGEIIFILNLNLKFFYGVVGFVDLVKVFFSVLSGLVIRFISGLRGISKYFFFLFLVRFN